MVAAVIFDLFGTVLHIQNRQNPYRRLLRIGAEQGRVSSPEDLRLIMTRRGGIREAASALEIELVARELGELQRSLELELASIQVYDDAHAALTLLRANGIKIGVCSNLAGPYCDEARRLLPGLDGYALSAECGVMKPNPTIYRSLCAMLGVDPELPLKSEHLQTVMIGDSKKCDEQGPRACGIMGFHLDRSGAGRFSDLFEFAHEIVSRSGKFCGVN
ncbi:HAD family hydrolase [Pseudomonas sp. WCS374]|uniref:HAD family hydrolase n=1 Tax=Pseudomonas sp. WCS374 TaxID=1495331 RepID=UPI00049A5DAB|nr:HAD family hydrolase [Pseudomonas sp. WCS374]AIB42903.1 hypothetical protein PD374_17865 [Pseudomonas sp. WCS374]